MQLRYNYRLDPRPRHRLAFGKAFGCARVVFNDALAARQQAHSAGHPFLTDADLSARLTAAKAAPERAWQRAGRKGPKPRQVGLPRFKSRKDTRQGIRFHR